MTQEVIDRVITDYALENANLRIQVATLEAELNELKNKETEGVVE